MQTGALSVLKCFNLLADFSIRFLLMSEAHFTNRGQFFANQGVFSQLNFRSERSIFDFAKTQNCIDPSRVGVKLVNGFHCSSGIPRIKTPSVDLSTFPGTDTLLPGVTFPGTLRKLVL